MRDSLDLKNRIIKRIQGVQRHKYWATSIARWTPLQLQYMPPHGPALSLLDALCCPEADGPTNLEQPTLNHVQSDTMASAVLADPTRALQRTNRGSRPVMEEYENDMGSLEQLLLYADEYYLAGKLPLGDPLGKDLHGVEEYHHSNVGPLRFHALQLK
ncbi:15-hydroxyprostaglandin dehydrogenase [Trichonephila clavipes]|nr:15-hydroxyprostaglandin dehydrogenase [Trichonephila clavipes]